MLRTVVCGVGGYLPDKIVTNDALAATLDTSDAWISQRTGIRQRHIAAPDQATSDMAAQAARRALQRAGWGAEDIDLIVVATSTPDNTFPATATAVQAKLGITQGAAFDVQAVCTGFVYALAVTDALLKTGAHRRALVIGADMNSRILDWSERGVCVLFGDGAGAVVVEAQPPEVADARGIISTRLRADGRYRDKLYVDGGPSTTGQCGKMRMDGKEIYKLAVYMVPEIVEGLLRDTQTDVAAIDWFIPHQANKRIIDATAARLGLPPEKVIVTIDKHANTSAASIPLAMAAADADGRLKPGDLCVLEAMGGGFTWAASLLRW